MPTSSNNNGWEHVVRTPPRKDRRTRSWLEIDTPLGCIFVQFLYEKVPRKVENATIHFINNNTNVRKIHGEDGRMAAGGHRIDFGNL